MQLALNRDVVKYNAYRPYFSLNGLTPYAVSSTQPSRDLPKVSNHLNLYTDKNLIYFWIKKVYSVIQMFNLFFSIFDFQISQDRPRQDDAQNIFNQLKNSTQPVTSNAKVPNIANCSMPSTIIRPIVLRPWEQKIQKDENIDDNLVQQQSNYASTKYYPIEDLPKPYNNIDEDQYKP